MTSAPTTLSLEDENAIRAMKSGNCNEKRVAKRKKRQLDETKEAAVVRVRVEGQRKECSLPSLAGNYVFCGITHRVKGKYFL